MNQIEALTRLLHLGAGNHKEITTAMQAVNQGSPIADVRALRALQHGVAELQCQETESEIMTLIGELSSHEKRGRLPDGASARDRQIQGRVTDDRKQHWNNYARQNNLTLWGLIEETVDKRTGYREE
jgi:hypothetical protein